MNERENVIEFIKNEYDILPDKPWAKYPENEVFRHKDSGKWFAIIIPIERKKVGLEGEKIVELLNVKLDSIMVDSLHTKEGFLPAYHMNKTNWLSVRLDGSVGLEMIYELVAQSYEATKTKNRKVKYIYEIARDKL